MFKIKVVGVGVALAAAASTVVLAAPANATDAGANAARSTKVYFENRTGCILVNTASSLDHGIWTNGVPRDVSDGQTITWESESSGFMTGTEGRAEFTAYECSNSSLNRKQVRVHWDNPFVGSNKYDEDGTDGAFKMTRSNGSGNNATVNWKVEGR
ncbi:aegerolysin family protein [Streptomyces sp. G45]|uniref:aegerolysin family protein n=1 Tax=Streptomyces sp. G45 TaxID=3406627 RepID=UPI003C244C0C